MSRQKETENVAVDETESDKRPASENESEAYNHRCGYEKQWIEEKKILSCLGHDYRYHKLDF